MKLYDEVVPDLVKYLTGTELKYFLAISQHVGYKDCIMRRTSNNLSDPISAKDFAIIHGYNYESTKKIFNSLKKKGVIAFVDRGTISEEQNIGIQEKIYLVNPYIYFRGYEINETVKSIFDVSGWEEKLSN